MGDIPAHDHENFPSSSTGTERVHSLADARISGVFFDQTRARHIRPAHCCLPRASFHIAVHGSTIEIRDTDTRVRAIDRRRKIFT